jgi:hypothetical protein
MSRSFDRTLKNVKQQLLGERTPDFTGWAPADILLWHAEHGHGLEVAVAAAMPSPEEREKQQAEYRALERERQATEADAPIAPVETTLDATPESSAAEPQPPVPQPPEPGMPKAEPQWWEERAHWRQRGPRDYEWEKPEYGRCLVEYDVLNWDNGYDPFGDDEIYDE